MHFIKKDKYDSTYTWLNFSILSDIYVGLRENKRETDETLKFIVPEIGSFSYFY